MFPEWPGGMDGADVLAAGRARIDAMIAFRSADAAVKGLQYMRTLLSGFFKLWRQSNRSISVVEAIAGQRRKPWPSGIGNETGLPRMLARGLAPGF